MNKKIVTLLLFTFILAFEVIYVCFIYEPSYNFVCDGEFSYSDSESKDLLDGNISFRSCIQCVDAPSNVVLTFNESANDPVMHFC